MKKYLTEDILDLSYVQWVTKMCDELNKAGIKRLNYDIEFEYDKFILRGQILHNAKALNYLKEIGLIDNGRCICGNPYDDNKYTVSSYKNKDLTVYICKDCHMGGTEYQRKLNTVMNPQNSSKSGCMSSVVFCGVVLFILSILI